MLSQNTHTMPDHKKQTLKKWLQPRINLPTENKKKPEKPNKYRYRIVRKFFVKISENFNSMENFEAFCSLREISLINLRKEKRKNLPQLLNGLTDLDAQWKEFTNYFSANLSDEFKKCLEVLPNQSDIDLINKQAEKRESYQPSKKHGAPLDENETPPKKSKTESGLKKSSESSVATYFQNFKFAGFAASVDNKLPPMSKSRKLKEGEELPPITSITSLLQKK